MKHFLLIVTALISVLTLTSGCSVKTTAVDLVANSLSKDAGGEVFSGDDDPELVGEALPFAIKMYESLVAATPHNAQLLLATGKALCTYSFAFIQTPAEQLSNTDQAEKEEQLQRAKRLHLRGRDYILRGIALRHRGFRAALERNDMAAALKNMTVRDTSYLYWAGMSWMAAFTADKADVTLTTDIPKAFAFIQKVYDLKSTYGDGAVHEFFVSYYGSMPAAMGGSEEKARAHFAKAIELAHGTHLAPYLSLAISVCVKNQNLTEFRELLNKALSIDVNKDKKNRLANLINQQKARWLLDHYDNYFLVEEGDTAK